MEILELKCLQLSYVFDLKIRNLVFLSSYNVIRMFFPIQQTGATILMKFSVQGETVTNVFEVNEQS